MSDCLIGYFSSRTRYLHDNGHAKACDKLVSASRRLFPNETSVCGQIWSLTKTQLDFERAVYASDWRGAEEAASAASAGPAAPPALRWEPDLMRLKLCLAKGDADGGRRLASNLVKTSWDDMSPSHRYSPSP